MTLALAPPGIALLITLGALLHRPAAEPLIALAYLGGTVGPFLAALRFDRGDQMRLAWGSLAVANCIAAIGIALISGPFHTPDPQPSPAAWLENVRLAMDLVLNALTVFALALFSRVWRSLGLQPPWYRQATALAFALGCLVVGPSLIHALEAMISGPARPWSMLISPTADLLAITLMGPLAASAVAMRGGALMWPYVFLSADCVAWLFFDAGALLSGDAQRIADSFLASTGMLYCGAAGLAHRRVLSADT